MTDERLHTLFHTTFDGLHAPAAQNVRPPRRRRVLRPSAALTLALAFVFGGALGVGATALYGGHWPSLFGYTYTEVEPEEGALRQFAVEEYSLDDLNLPEGEVATCIEMDDPFTLPEGVASTTGLILMEDGRLYLRRAGQEDERIDEQFSEEREAFPYTDENLTPLEGVCLGRYEFTYERLGETVPATAYRLQDGSGHIGYAVCHGEITHYLYGQFDCRCFAYFLAQYVSPSEDWVNALNSNPDLS